MPMIPPVLRPTAVGGGAIYRLTVTNTGTSDLENVVINDAALGIVDFLVGDLAAGQTVVLTQGEIPELEQPGRCQDPGDVTNVATVEGQSVIGNTVGDSDPAVVRCVEEDIDLLKEVSVDGGVTFFDANDSASAPAHGRGWRRDLSPDGNQHRHLGPRERGDQ